MQATLFLITFIWISTSQAADRCEDVLDDCYSTTISWTRCFEDRIATCTTRLRSLPGFVQLLVNSSQEVEANPTLEHKVHIPSSALKRSRGAVSKEEVTVVATVINSTYFKLSPPPRKGRRFHQPVHRQGTVLGGLVLAVRAGNIPVQNLLQPVTLTFKHDHQVENGTCVFWEESVHESGTGNWNTEGCDTSDSGSEYICSCNHLSFFAVLVNPVISVDKRTAVTLSYITYIGSALSVILTLISLIIYICLHRRRPEKSISLHMQLTGALLCLHLSFLLCSFWVRQLRENEEGWVCRGLGFFLQWSLLATFSWMALEGFHLYLLLVRVFNIYIRRYLLKLSLVGWGVPTLVAVVCGISNVYGKYSLKMKNGSNHVLEAQICWLNSQFLHTPIIIYITTVAFPCLVVLYNSCMLGLVVFKLWRLKGGRRGFESSSDWRKLNKQKGSRLWKDCATVLGLSCVLGLPWGLTTATYISTPWIYVFTILNSLQGVFVFLWSVALTCKSHSDNNSSSRDTSSQKIMMTSLKN